MNKFKSEELINELQADVKQIIAAAEHLQTADPVKLNYCPAEGAWSVAQVLEHLNAYNRYYLPAIENSMIASTKPATPWFKAGWIGNYFTKLMRPGYNGKIKYKMKAPKNHTPKLVVDAKAVLKAFNDQQIELLRLLEDAKYKNIGSIRTPISISRFIKLKTGDTFRFLIAHEQRHFLQIKQTLQSLKGEPVISSITKQGIVAGI